MSKKSIFKLIVIVSVILIIGCFVFRSMNNSEYTVYASSQDNLPYNIFLPDKIIQLSNKLAEISGISYYDDKTIACCEDETGTIYLINIESGEITHSYKFTKDADYEDIEVVEDTLQDMEKNIYVLRSDGNIYRIKRLGSTSQKVKKYKSFLNNDDNAEGLCYLRDMNVLLIACKGLAGPGAKRALYVFDLNEKEMLPEPLFIFGLDESTGKSIKNINMSRKFQPSGISIHPVTGYIYIISSVGKIILVINSEGEIVSLSSLPKDVFRQPEGICFFPNGDLYISNEGKGGKGNILQFKNKK